MDIKTDGKGFPSHRPLVLEHNHTGPAPNRFPFWPEEQLSRHPANSPWQSLSGDLSKKSWLRSDRPSCFVLSK